MEVSEIRRRNLRMLVDKAKGPTLFSARIDRTPNLVSQWLTSKPIGNRVARHIDKALGKEPGWLDAPRWAHEIAEEQAVYSTLDRDVMRRAIIAVDREFARAGARADSPESRAEIVLALYDLLQSGAAEDVAARTVAGMLHRVTALSKTQ
jgi:hypothetical protein